MEKRHWATWFIGCIMGLLPLIAWFLAHYLAGGRETVGSEATRELVFFALSTSSTAMLSLGENAREGRSPLWNFFALILTIVSAVFYGEFLIGDALHAVLRVRFAYNLSIGLAVVALFYGVLTEEITHRRSTP